MSGVAASPWILGTFLLSSSSSSLAMEFSTSPATSGGGAVCRSHFRQPKDLKFVLHDALDSSGFNTTYARKAREGFFSQIRKLSDIERETSIIINGEVDLGKTALHIAAEDDSLISHSSVPLPVDAFMQRLDGLSRGYCSRYHSSFRSSPDNFLECLERYMYVDKGFRRTNSSNQLEQRAVYLHSVLTHRVGSMSMLSLIYSEILKMLRLWGLLNFDVEISSHNDSYGSPRGYIKQKTTESDQQQIVTTESLLLKILRDLKNAFWPFQLDQSRSPFLRAAEAAYCSDRSADVDKSGLQLASAKAARHRLERGVWTSVRFGDIRRALSACERLIILEADSMELRDYGVLLYHCGFYKESLQYLKLYQDTEKSTTMKQLQDSLRKLEDDAVEKLIIRLNLILMEDDNIRPSSIASSLYNNTDPW
ncbi:uncharacterized protein LOC112523057 isoform X1 [Cynara cardunculus var. scolymus]|uniref:uncharacterized protein LOC112523057 isoform X1 n=1 Tax=Cynara cardunculus var. scolymus TaxID=59895 RepID=UPI000D6296AD|nr:uncharacterized protein LOC112523057 isoform X1 [Cynara cardunculus var. scolymus]